MPCIMRTSPVCALVAGLDLLPVTPSGHPLKDLTKAPVFAAMIPMQVYNSLQVPEERAILQQIRHLIIGGGPIDSQLNAALKDFPHAVWSTYGMTETLSHIALRRLNGPEASDWYTPFESIQIRLSKENTLVIYAPEICGKELVTNDIAEINGQNQFRILGRKDNTINTGGVKVQIEQVEAALKEHLVRSFLDHLRSRRKIRRNHCAACRRATARRHRTDLHTSITSLLASQTFCSGIQTSPDRNRETRPCHSQITGAKITPLHS